MRNFFSFLVVLFFGCGLGFANEMSYVPSISTHSNSSYSEIQKTIWPKKHTVKLKEPMPHEITTISEKEHNKAAVVKPRKKILKKTNSKEKISLPAGITGLETFGAINIHVIAGSQKNYMLVKDASPSHAIVNYKVEDGVLIIRLNYANHDLIKKIFHHQTYHATINLYLKHLNKLSKHGPGSMWVQYRNSQALQIEKTGSGNLFIKGNKIRLAVLKNEGDGNITINRVYSNGLYVMDYGSGDVNIVGSRVNLRRVDSDNSGRLSINYIRSKGLTLDLHNDGYILLTGEMKVAKINYSGSGALKMYWIKSSDLTINTTGTGSLALAGVANVVNANAYDKSHLDLRYLRADTAFIKSYGDASVDVWANENLYSLAENNSNIYYYSNPGYITDMMRQAGTILPMSDIPGAIVDFNTKGSIGSAR